MSLRFAVVHEADADVRTATELADRVLVESIDWLDEDLVFHQRIWVAATSEGKQLTWTGMKDLAREANIKAHGHFDGDPGFPDAAAARKAIRYLLKTMRDELDAIVLIRDQDDQPTRLKGLKQARTEHRRGKEVVVVGFAIVERECWVLSGFDPLNDDETLRLAEEKKKLGFDPRSRNHELTACKNDQAVHSPKRVLRKLTADDRDRERLCWMETPLATLRQRGSDNGLEAFLAEVRDRLGPLIEKAT